MSERPAALCEFSRAAVPVDSRTDARFDARIQLYCRCALLCELAPSKLHVKVQLNKVLSLTSRRAISPATSTM